MKALLSHWFKPIPSSPGTDEEIPRYPPFAKGLPATPIARVLATQSELLGSLKHTLALPEDEHRIILAPVLERYAAFTHLLPASESHHHSGAGGLLRHGLEVAYWATRASESVLFGLAESPRVRKHQEKRWRLAVCLAGLLHDIGKPVSDLSVVDRDGATVWNPYLMNLSDWALQQGIDRYFLRWRDKRHQRHEQFSVLVSERVLTPACLSYLTEYSPEILQKMLEAMAGIDKGDTLGALVMEADRKSVEKDLLAHHRSMESSLGVPVDKYLMDAMRRLIREGCWRCNQKGARVWHFQEGVHIVWKAAAADITQLLAQDRIPGITRDPDSLADILIERGLAIPRMADGGVGYRYWRMVPDELGIPLYMLRLTSVDSIFPGEPPAIIGGRHHDDSMAETVPQREGLSDRSEIQPPAPVVHTNTETAHASTQPADKSIPASSPPSLATIKPQPAEPIPESLLLETASEDIQPPLVTNDKLQRPVDMPPEPGRIEADHWLAQHASVPRLIEVLRALFRIGPETGIRLVNKQLWIPHPQAAKLLGHNPGELLELADRAGCIESDVMAPLQKIRELNGERGLLFSSTTTRRVRSIVGELPEASAHPITSAVTDHAEVSLPEPVKAKTANQSPINRTRRILENLPRPEDRLNRMGRHKTSRADREDSA